jgi:hypothetical protein
MVGDYKADYTGWRLDQADLNVLLACVDMVRVHGNGGRSEVRVGVRAFLRELGLEYSSGNRTWLTDSLQRLQACSVRINKGKRTYFGAFLGPMTLDDAVDHFVITVNPDLIPLFHGGWSALQWDLRKRMKGFPLALWLHSFTAGMGRPLTFTVDELRALSGSSAKSNKPFLESLELAVNHCNTVGHPLQMKLSKDQGKGRMVTLSLGKLIGADPSAT